MVHPQGAPMSGSLPPTEKRRREAREAGQVPATPLAPAAAALVAGALIAWATGGGAVERIASLARAAWSGLDPGAAASLIVPTVARVALPLALGAWLAAVAVGALQTRGLFSLAAFRRTTREPPEPERDGALRPVAWALAIALSVLVLVSVRSTARALASAQGLAGAAQVVAAAARTLLPRALLLIAAAALGDWAWRRLRHERALLMTRAEVERERREEEGDPRLRAERRRRHRAVVSGAEPRKSEKSEK
jgi:flagellar biosynthesis protein FlhB